MANQFINLPANAANGPGAAVDVSALGASKYIVIAGAWPSSMVPTITIEINNDDTAQGTWSPLLSVQGGAIRTVAAAAKWMRVNVSGYRQGPAPEVDVGATDGGCEFVALPAPAGNGNGDPVDVSALGSYKTFTVGNAFNGAVVIDVSEDGQTNWAQVMSFNRPGMQSITLLAHWMRVRRVGVPVIAPGAPIVSLGGANDAGGGGGGDLFWAAGTGTDAVVQGIDDRNVAAGDRALATGSGASALRESQHAHANGSFAADGDAQTSVIVMHGVVPGAAPGESVELMFGDAGDQTLQLENSHAYTIEVSAVARDPNNKGTQSWVQRYCVQRVGGVTTIEGVGADDHFGSDASKTWTLVASVGAGPDRFVLTFTTTGAQAAARCVATLRITEVNAGAA